uniref:helix-turn-helix domain-containing protein n=1 Tax=Rickettsia endosymbiont of Ixodes pacificus TaxID=1133329 RepID=UPI00067A55F7|nr:helix-turn-helix transcriptional regulator [Rickettsia endosymbiont of Ixodes pacificus]AKS10312.1 helix-turn-helix protein [Rickettsia endosymbiont of Ixodes pacificus]
MSIINNLQLFLLEKIKQHKINKKLLSHNCGIPYTTIVALFKSKHLNPSFSTLLKLADYFDCTIDELVGNKHKSNQVSKMIKVDISESMGNLRQFLINNTKKEELYAFSEELGLGYNAIYTFVYNKSKNRTLNSATILLIAQRYKTSIDKLIGRLP